MLVNCPKCHVGKLTTKYDLEPSCYACGYYDMGVLPIGLGTEATEEVTEHTGRRRKRARRGPDIDRVRLPKWGDASRERLRTKVKATTF
jgi:hypothetical protein